MPGDRNEKAWKWIGRAADLWTIIAIVGLAAMVAILFAAWTWIWGLPTPILAICVLVAVTCTVVLNRRSKTRTTPVYKLWQQRKNAQAIEGIHRLFRLSYEGEGAYQVSYNILESFVTVSLACEEKQEGDEALVSGDFKKHVLLQYLRGLLQRAILDRNRAALSALSNALTLPNDPHYGNFERIQELFTDYYSQYKAVETWISQTKPLIRQEFLPHENLFSRYQRLHEEFERELRSLISKAPFQVLAKGIRGSGI